MRAHRVEVLPDDHLRFATRAKPFAGIPVFVTRHGLGSLTRFLS